MKITDLETQFTNAQVKVVASLQKEVDRLKTENEHLKLMLEATVPVLENKSIDIGISNQRIIAETQLALLKNSAISRELTLEETRKFQIYVDSLEKMKNEKDDGINANTIPESELLRLVKDE